jgi:hypothetical protein
MPDRSPCDRVALQCIQELRWQRTQLMPDTITRIILIPPRPLSSSPTSRTAQRGNAARAEHFENGNWVHVIVMRLGLVAPVDVQAV